MTHPEDYMHSTFKLTTFAALLTACGGTSDPSVIAPIEGGPPEDVPLEDAAAPRDAGAVDAAPPPVALPPARDDRIDPIEVGRSWTYNVKVLGIYPACSSGVFTSTAVEQSVIEGKAAIHVQSLCEKAGVFKYSIDGDRVLSHFGGEWRVSLETPVAEGHEWSDGYRSYEWKSEGTFVSAAGTFKDCWSARVVAKFDSYTLFCRGVGPVKWHYEDGFGNGYEALLVAKSF